MTAAGRVLAFEWSGVLWGEKPIRDAAGRAGSLRGPRRVFFCAPSELHPSHAGTQRRRCAASDHVQPLIPAKSLSPESPILLTVARGLSIRGYMARCTFFTVRRRPLSILVGKHGFLPSERPHECQFGSGEAIRTAVRQTFQSRWLRSSDSSPAISLATTPPRVRYVCVSSAFGTDAMQIVLRTV